MTRDGFTAAPGLMWATTALSLIAGVSASLYPYGFVVLTDALRDDRAGGVWLGVVLTGALVAVGWTAAMFDANIGFELVDRTTLLVSTRVAEMVNRIAVMGHLERPDVLADLEMVEQNRDAVAAAPRAVLQALQAAVRGLVVVVLLWSVRPVLALLPLVAAAPVLAEARAGRIRDRADAATSGRRALRDELFETTMSVRPAAELRVYRLTDELAARHARLAAEVAHATARASAQATAVAVSGWLVFLVAFAGALALTVDAAVAGDVSPGHVLLTVVLGQQAHQVLTAVTDAARALLTSARTVERINGIQERLAPPPDGGAPAPERLAVGIDLQGVSLRYPGAGRDALASVDLHLPAGATVALVGENGAGKSTLVKVLSGMYEPTEGRVLVDGVDLATMATTSWRARLAATFQDFVRFELVARETVGIGDLPRVDDDGAVRSAMDRAGVTGLAGALPAGLDSPLGRSLPDGADLSSGQWQQLAVARSMMRSAPLLLVLDEPTASLDAEVEHELVGRYTAAGRAAAAASGCVTVIITHRFSTVAAADLVVVMGDGGVVEVGRHDDLVAAGGTYAQLLALQARGYA